MKLFTAFLTVIGVALAVASYVRGDEGTGVAWTFFAVVLAVVSIKLWRRNDAA